MYATPQHLPVGRAVQANRAPFAEHHGRTQYYPLMRDMLVAMPSTSHCPADIHFLGGEGNGIVLSGAPDTICRAAGRRSRFGLRLGPMFAC
jgi:hypothetical protein